MPSRPRRPKPRSSARSPTPTVPAWLPTCRWAASWHRTRSQPSRCGWRRRPAASRPAPRSISPAAARRIEARRTPWLLRGLRQGLAGELLLDQGHPIGGADRQDLVVEVVARIVDHAAAFAVAIADPDVAARLLEQHPGEILAAHGGRRVAVDVVEADQGGGRAGGGLRLLHPVDPRPVTPLGAPPGYLRAQ